MVTKTIITQDYVTQTLVRGRETHSRERKSSSSLSRYISIFDTEFYKADMLISEYTVKEKGPERGL